MERQRFLEDKFRLRHGPFKGIDQEQHAVHHPKNPLYLTPEIRMTGRIDKVDLDVLVANRGILREDRNTPLLLEGIRVHNNGLALFEDIGPRLSKQGIHERGLSMIDVGDDRHIAHIFSSFLMRHGPVIQSQYSADRAQSCQGLGQ